MLAGLCCRFWACRTPWLYVCTTGAHQSGHPGIHPHSSWPSSGAADAFAGRYCSVNDPHLLRVSQGVGGRAEGDVALGRGLVRVAAGAARRQIGRPEKHPREGVHAQARLSPSNTPLSSISDPTTTSQTLHSLLRPPLGPPAAFKEHKNSTHLCALQLHLAPPSHRAEGV